MSQVEQSRAMQLLCPMAACISTPHSSPNLLQGLTTCLGKLKVFSNQIAVFCHVIMMSSQDVRTVMVCIIKDV